MLTSKARNLAASSIGAGRGLVLITAAKLWFMVAGYVVQFGLPRALGDQARFGLWMLVLNCLSPVNNVVITGTIQGVSKFAAESDERVSAVLRAGLRMQVLVGGSLALAFFLLAPAVAHFERAPELTAHLRLAAGVVLAYSFYAVFIGAANGARAFHKQAGLDMTFSTLRATLVVGAAVLTHSSLAAVGGFVAAAATILVVAALVVGFGPPPAARFPVRRLWRFFAGVAVYLLILNLLMFVDGLLVHRLVAEAPGGAGTNAIRTADALEGVYGAAQTIARIPYQLILAVTFIVFPLVSRATFEHDEERTRGYVRATMRYSLVAAALLAVTLGARPEATMRLFYPAGYAASAPALGVLLGGYVCFSLFAIAGTVINGAGGTLATSVIGGITLILDAAANQLAISFALAHGRDPLLAAALATTLAMAAGVVMSGIYLYRKFGASLPPLSALRVLGAAAVSFAVLRVWPGHGWLGGKLGTLASMAAAGALFLLLAVASGELRPAELRKLGRAGGAGGEGGAESKN